MLCFLLPSHPRHRCWATVQHTLVLVLPWESYRAPFLTLLLPPTKMSSTSAGLASIRAHAVHLGLRTSISTLHHTQVIGLTKQISAGTNCGGLQSPLIWTLADTLSDHMPFVAYSDGTKMVWFWQNLPIALTTLGFLLLHLVPSSIASAWLARRVRTLRRADLSIMVGCRSLYMSMGECSDGVGAGRYREERRLTKPWCVISGIKARCEYQCLSPLF